MNNADFFSQMMPPQAGAEAPTAPQAPAMFAPMQAPAMFAPMQAPAMFAPTQAPAQPQYDPALMFANVGSAQRGLDAKYFEPGKYLLSLQEIKTPLSNEGKGPLLITSWKVEQSNLADFPQGKIVSHVMKALGNRYFDSDCRNLAVSLAGLDEDTDAERVKAFLPQATAYLVQAVNTQGLTGKQVLLTCTSKPKKDGGGFTKHVYQAYKAPTP